MSWTTPEEVRRRLRKRWDGVRFLADVAENDPALSSRLFPLRVPLRGPAAREMSERFEEVRRWVQQYVALESAGPDPAPPEVEWQEIAHRHLGRNRLPRALVFRHADQLAQFLGRSAITELQAYRRMRTLVREKARELEPLLHERPRDMLAVHRDLDRLIAVWQWMRDNPAPGIYLRQLPVANVDTKFVERHRRTLASWLAGRWISPGDFEGNHGFLPRPVLVRFRVLDPALQVGPFSDVTVPVDEFNRWTPPGLTRVIVLENDITALALPPVPGAIAIFGRGYCFDALRTVPWLQDPHRHLMYWGDLDTHGFAILDQFRREFPGVQSILMDRETLMAHQLQWGQENKPVQRDLPHLTPSEQALYDDLRHNRYQENLRLEQELIAMSHVEEALRACVTTHCICNEN